MLDIDKLYYIMDYSGNYYRINDKNDLVIAKNTNEAAVFSFIEANKRINVGHKNRFYLMKPIKDMNEEYQNNEDEVIENSQPVLEYDISQIDWQEYLTHFTYVIEVLAGYRDSLIKAESDVDLKICDILHYIELCDTSVEEAACLVNLLKECREHRRDVKDEIVRLDAFQRTVGTSANLVKAKEAIKSIKRLETRRYTPRKLSELFEGRTVNMLKNGVKPYEEQTIEKEMIFKRDTIERENDDMDMIRKETTFDGKDNDWMEFAMQQAEFYRNAKQYIINIKLDIQDIGEEISKLMDEIDTSNCNVAQGYKLFKRLKELRIGQKEKEKELQCLYILTERFDINVMADECEDKANELGRLLYPEDNVEVYKKENDLEQTETVNAGVNGVSVAV